MKGLLLKDLFNLNGQLKVYIVFPLLAVFFAYQAQDMTTMTLYVSMMTMFIVISACAYDEHADFHPYALTLPITKKELVLSKYILGFIVMIGAWLICLIGTILMISIFGTAHFANFEFKNYFIESVMVALTANALTCLLLPLMFKYGTEKARIYMVVLFLVIGASGYMMVSLNLNINFEALQVLENYIIYIAAALFILIEAGSLYLSTRIMEKKEF